ncbi:helix-turn-helix domain-containing protein [Sphingobacterium sp.]|uniref:helix-turn-helix domain-containing protein n=1 Tax=Sphingobacterium sp. TaxID=341027 RepID=UPI0025871ADF|nr:helix-turn-helix domain-containing protein [Sphingobacterium sp.]WET69047.1 MAG: helix-turn-helix domain-containing protein [Sphingobacterium sp.]
MEEGVTKDDLRQFRLLIIGDIRELLEERKVGSDSSEKEEWLRSKEIRRILNISAGTLQNLRIQEKVRYRKIMGSYYYNRFDLLELFKVKE